MGALVLKNTFVLASIYMSLFSLAKGDALEKFRIEKLQLQCYAETKCDPFAILMVRAGEWEAGEKNVLLQRWALCLLVRYGIMSRRGVFRLTSALAKFPEDEHSRVIEDIDRCLYTTRHYPREIAWHYLRCINRRDPTELRLL